MTQFVGIQLHMIAGNWDYFPFVSCQDFFLASIPDNIACFCLDVAMACMKTNAYTYNNNEQIYMCDIWINFGKESRGLNFGNLNCDDLNYDDLKSNPREGLAPWALLFRFNTFSA